MELKEKLISSFMAFEERIDVHAELHDVRTAIKTLKIKVSQKEEAWKYTSLNTKNDFTVFPNKTITFNILM
jgi:Fe-S cluster assembly protein SufD